jgi:hypothetical protein
MLTSIARILFEVSYYGYSRRKIGLSMDDLWEPKKKNIFLVGEGL